AAGDAEPEVGERVWVLPSRIGGVVEVASYSRRFGASESDESPPELLTTLAPDVPRRMRRIRQGVAADVLPHLHAPAVELRIDVPHRAEDAPSGQHDGAQLRLGAAARRRAGIGGIEAARNLGIRDVELEVAPVDPVGGGREEHAVVPPLRL